MLLLLLQQRALERVSALESLLRGSPGDAAQHADRVEALEAEVSSAAATAVGGLVAISLRCRAAVS